MEAKSRKTLNMIQISNTVNMISPNSPEENEAIVRDAQMNMDDGKKVKTYWTRYLMEMTVWYLIPSIYILFTIIYTAIYSF
jgi:hypothetical protein